MTLFALLRDALLLFKWTDPGSDRFERLRRLDGLDFRGRLAVLKNDLSLTALVIGRVTCMQTSKARKVWSSILSNKKIR